MLKELGCSALLCLFVGAPLMGRGARQPTSAEQVNGEQRPGQASGQAQQEPLSEPDFENLLKENKGDLKVVYKALQDRGVDFDLDTKIERKMRKAGADDNLLQAIWNVGPTGRNSKSATLTNSVGVPLHATYAEAIGYKTIEDELDRDKRLRMVDLFEQRFPHSELMSLVYTQAANACREKGDLNRIVEYGEKSLKLDPDNLFSLLMVAITLPQPRMLERNEANSAQLLTEAETDANHALKLIDKLPPQSTETEEQLKKRKDSLASDAHGALATVDMERDDDAKAIEEFKTAISLSEKPNPQLYFRLGEVCETSGKKAEAIDAFTKASKLGSGTVLQQYADRKIADQTKK